MAVTSARFNRDVNKFLHARATDHDIRPQIVDSQPQRKQSQQLPGPDLPDVARRGDQSPGESPSLSMDFRKRAGKDVSVSGAIQTQENAFIWRIFVRFGLERLL
jgi:hypothetical protein